jgi:hypothetical protein
MPETEADRIAAQFGGEEQSFADRYAMYRDDERAVTEQFAEENPMAATGLEVAGAVLSPLNRVAPGLGTTGGTGARIAGSAARAAGEGALYGLGQGEGDIEDQLTNAAKGALTGAGVAGALTGGGGALGRAVSASRIKERLQDAAGNFKPLHMADAEGTLGKLYRSVVGGAWGGRGALGRQESRYLNRDPRLARFADDAGQVVPEGVGTARAVGEVKDRIQDTARVAKDSAKRAARQIEADEALETSTHALKRSVPAEYADQITEVGVEGVRQADDIIRRSYAQAWGDTIANPVALGNAKSVYKQFQNELGKKERATVNRLLKDMQEGKPLQVIDRELRETLNSKTSAAMSNVVNSMRSSLRSVLPAERQGILAATDEIYPNFLASLRASTSKGAQKRGGVFNADELSSAARQAKGWRQSGKGENELFEYARPVLQKTRAAIDATKQRGKRAGEVARASTNRLKRAAEGVLPEERTAWSQLAATSILGGLGMMGGLPAVIGGIGVARGLASPKVQKALVGQTAWQEALAKALREGDTATYQRIISRLSAQQATGD